MNAKCSFIPLFFFFVLQLRSPSSSHDDVNLGPSANPQSVTFRSFYVVQRGVTFDAHLNVLSVVWVSYCERIWCFKSLQIDIAYIFLYFMHQNTDSLKEKFTQKSKIPSLSTHPHSDGKSGKVMWSTKKHF